MKKFEDKSLNEKINTIRDENENEDIPNLIVNNFQALKIKFFILLPLIAFFIFFFIVNSNSSFTYIINILIFPVFLIFIGVLLYYFMINK